jgi:hypothetical protein
MHYVYVLSLLQKLMVAQVVKLRSAFYGARSFTTMYTRTHNLTLD